MLAYLLTMAAPDMLSDYNDEDLAEQILYAGSLFRNLADAQETVETALGEPLDWEHFETASGVRAWRAEQGIGRYLIRELEF